MTTSELFKKHFGDVCSANLKHPNVEAFFTDLNEQCIEEDRQRKALAGKQAICTHKFDAGVDTHTRTVYKCLICGLTEIV